MGTIAGDAAIAAYQSAWDEFVQAVRESAGRPITPYRLRGEIPIVVWPSGTALPCVPRTARPCRDLLRAAEAGGEIGADKPLGVEDARYYWPDIEWVSDLSDIAHIATISIGADRRYYWGAWLGAYRHLGGYLKGRRGTQSPGVWPAMTRDLGR